MEASHFESKKICRERCMRAKESVIIIALMVLLAARADGASRDDTVGASQILDEHRLGSSCGRRLKTGE